MDSLVVARAADLAAQLGTQAKVVLIWWLIAKMVVPVVWAGVATFAVARASAIASRIGDGARLCETVRRCAMTEYPKADQYALAARLIVENWPQRQK